MKPRYLFLIIPVALLYFVAWLAHEYADGTYPFWVGPTVFLSILAMVAISVLVITWDDLRRDDR